MKSKRRNIGRKKKEEEGEKTRSRRRRWRKIRTGSR